MQEYKIKQIIEKILKQYCKKRVILMLNGSSIYADEILKILNKYEEIEYQYIESESSKNIKGLDKIKDIGKKLENLEEIELCIEQSDLILMPFLTRNTLSKMSLGIADDILTTSIQLAIMKNKKILALDSTWSPQSENNKIKKLNLNNAYNKMLLNYKNTIEEFGVKSIPIYNLDEEIKLSLYEKNILDSGVKEHSKIEDNKLQNNKIENSESKNIEDDSIKYITKKDLEQKEEIHINKNSKLTALAKDYILQKNIKVYKSN